MLPAFLLLRSLAALVVYFGGITSFACTAVEDWGALEPVSQQNAKLLVLVLFAAATSAVSLMETNVQMVSQELGVSRFKAMLCVLIETLGIGVITLLGYSLLKNVHPLSFIAKYRTFDILDSLDFLSNSVLMPIGAIFTTMLVVAVVGLERFSKEVRGGKKRHWYREYIFQLCMTLLVIPGLLVILLNALGILA